MEEYELIFKKFTGKYLIKNFVNYKSDDEIDETIFESVSRLLFENKKAFYYLKNKITELAKNKKDALLFSVVGYFCYVDCDFTKARKFFQKAIEINPQDLDPWFCLGFSFRQLGKEEEFASIMLHYKEIIRDLTNGKGDINELISKYTGKK